MPTENINYDIWGDGVAADKNNVEEGAKENVRVQQEKAKELRNPDGAEINYEAFGTPGPEGVVPNASNNDVSRDLAYKVSVLKEANPAMVAMFDRMKPSDIVKTHWPLPENATPETIEHYRKTGATPSSEVLTTVLSSMWGWFEGGVQSAAHAGILTDEEARPLNDAVRAVKESGLSVETPQQLWSAVKASFENNMEDAAKVYEEVQMNRTFIPRTEEGREKLHEIGESPVLVGIGKAFDWWEMKAGDVFNVGEGETGPFKKLAATALYTAPQVLNPKVYLKPIFGGLKSAKNLAMYPAKAATKRIAKKSTRALQERAAGESLATAAGISDDEAKAAAKTIKGIRKEIKDFDPDLAAATGNKVVVSKKRELDEWSSLNWQKASKKKAAETAKIKAAERTRYGVHGDEADDFVTLMKDYATADLARAETDIARLTQKGVQAFEKLHLSGTSADDISRNFYDLFIEIEQRARAVGRTKFNNLSEIPNIPVDKVMPALKAARVNYAVDAVKLSPMLKRIEQQLSGVASGMGGLAKGKTNKASIKVIHDALSDLKAAQRALGNSDHVLRGEAIGQISKLINKIQGEGGLLDDGARAIKNPKVREEYLGATKYWKEQVIDRFETDPFWKVGSFDKHGKHKVLPAETIKSVIGEIKKGNKEAYTYFERVIGHPNRNPQAVAQLKQTIFDDIARTHLDTNTGALNLKTLKRNLRKDIKLNRMLDAVPGMRKELKHHVAVAKAIEKERVRAVALRDIYKKQELMRALLKTGDNVNTSEVILKAIKNPVFAKQLNKVFLRHPEGKKAAAEMISSHIMDLAGKGMEGGRNGQKILNFVEENRKGLTALLGANRVKVLERYGHAWKMQNRMQLPTNVKNLESTETTGILRQAARGISEKSVSIFTGLYNAERIGISKIWVAGKAGTIVVHTVGRATLRKMEAALFYDFDAAKILTMMAKKHNLTNAEKLKLIKKVADIEGTVPIAIENPSKPFLDAVKASHQDLFKAQAAIQTGVTAGYTGEASENLQDVKPKGNVRPRNRVLP